MLCLEFEKKKNLVRVFVRGKRGRAWWAGNSKLGWLHANLRNPGKKEMGKITIDWIMYEELG